jgi:hypothetical protein
MDHGAVETEGVIQTPGFFAGFFDEGFATSSECSELASVYLEIGCETAAPVLFTHDVFLLATWLETAGKFRPDCLLV